jgi:hypothetical protein
MIIFKECLEENINMICFIEKTLHKYIKKLRLEHWDIHVYVIDGEESNLMAEILVHDTQYQACLTIDVKQHIENDELDEKALEVSIVHELLHLLMENVDKIADYGLKGTIKRLYEEAEERVVERLAQVISR